MTAVIVLAVALWTAGSGLRLGGWWPTPASAALAATAPAETVVVANGTQTITVQARTNSYPPTSITAAAGVPTKLVVVTRGTNGCVRSFVVPDRGVQEILPVTGEKAIDLATPEPGTVAFTCGMGMYGGEIRFHLPAAPTTASPNSTIPQETAR
ncbi:cupredoxin domain-containing protein [Streptomyces sp. NPDC055254]